MKYSILGFYVRHELRTGAHRRYLELLSALAQSGWDVTVIVSNTLDLEMYHFNKILVEPVHRSKIPYSLKQLHRVKSHLSKLHSANWIALAFGETNYPTLKLVRRRLNAKIIFAFRSNSYKAFKNLFDVYNKTMSFKELIIKNKLLRVERAIVKLSDLLIFQSEFDKSDILTRTGVRNTKTYIIPNSLNESWFDKSYKNLNKSVKLEKIIYLGNYDIRKGSLFLLKAFNILKKRGIKIELDLFGGGNERFDLQKYVDDNQLNDLINVNGKMENPISKIHNYDLMVIPSIYDSYPNVILESIFTGTPVIASNNSGMKAILENEELLFDTGSPEDIANRIDFLYNNPEEYQKVKTLCRKRAEVHDFSWPEKFSGLFKTLV